MRFAALLRLQAALLLLKYGQHAGQKQSRG
jgi:hypothetical protein